MEQHKGDFIRALEEAVISSGSQHLTEESQEKAAEALLLALQDGLRGNRAVPGNVWAVVEAAERAYPVQQSPSIERARAVAHAAPGRDLVATWVLQAAADGALGPFVANLRRQPHIASAYAPGALLRDGVKVARLEAAVGRMKGLFPSPFELLQRERGQAQGSGGSDTPGTPPPAAAHIQTEADVLPQRGSGSGDGAAPAAAVPVQEAPAAVAAAAGKAGLALARDLSSRVRAAGMLWRSGDAASPRSQGPAVAAAAALLAVSLEVTEAAPGSGGVDPSVKLRLQVKAPPGSPVAGGRPQESSGPAALAAIAASKVANSLQRGVLPALPGNVARAALAAARGGGGGSAASGSGGEAAGAAAAAPGAAEKASPGAPAAQLASSVLQGIKQTAEATVAGGQEIGASVGAALANQVAAVRGGLGLLKPRQASDESPAATATAADGPAAAEEDEDMWSGLRRLGRSQANASTSDAAAAAAPSAEQAAATERRRANEASGAAVAARAVAAARRAAAAAAAAPGGAAVGDEAPALPDLVTALSEALSHGLRRPPPPGGGGSWGVSGLAGWLPSRRCSAFGALQALEAGGRGRPRVLVGAEGIARLQAARGASDDARLDFWLRSSLNDQLLGARLAALAAAAGRAGLAEWYEPGALLLQGTAAGVGAAPAPAVEGSQQQQEQQQQQQQWQQEKTEDLASLVEAVRELDGFRFALRMDPGGKQQAADGAAAAQQHQQQEQQSHFDARSPQKQQQQQGGRAKAAPVAAAVAAGRGLAVAVTAAPLNLAHQMAGSLATFQWPSASRRGAARRGANAAAAGGGDSNGDGSGSEALSPLSSSDEGGEPAWWNGTTWTAASASAAAAAAEVSAGATGGAGEEGATASGQQQLGAGVLVPAAGAVEGTAAAEGGSRQPSAAEQLLGELEAALAAPVPTLLQGGRSSWHGPSQPASHPEPAQPPGAAGTGGNAQHARKHSSSFSDLSQLQQQVATAKEP